MKSLIAVVATALLAWPALAQKNSTERFEAATSDVNSLLAASDKSVPQKLVAQAACIVVIPNLKKGGFIVGAQYGRGFFSCRKSSGSGWTAPGAMRVEGGKVGLLIGGAETDLVMLVMKEEGVNHLLSSKFTLGGELSVAGGPVGRDSTAMTDAQLHAEILTYSRQRGAYGGISLDGSTLREDTEVNREIYGMDVTNKTLAAGKTEVPSSAKTFIAALNRISPRKS